MVSDEHGKIRAQMDELRNRLNKELAENNFNLSAPSVMIISNELDRFIVKHYKEMQAEDITYRKEVKNERGK